MVRVIINSDDFGISAEVNNATIKAFAEKLISSTTAIMNFDTAAEAADLARGYNIPTTAIGIHLNLTSGVPLSEGIKKDDFFCEQDSFHARIRRQPIFQLNNNRQSLVYAELEAQLNKFIHTFGFPPSHIDGHHHIHTEWAISKIVYQLAKAYGIQKVRISRNTGNKVSFAKRLYKTIFNSTIPLMHTHYFGNINDFGESGFVNGKTHEIMVHCMLAGNVVVDDDQQPLAQKIQRLLANQSYQLIDYISL